MEQMYAAAEQYLQFYLQYPEYFRMLAYPADPGRWRYRSASPRRSTNRTAASWSRATWNGIIRLAWRPDELRCSEAELRDLFRAATDVIANGLLRTPPDEETAST
ncbi:hypothetical protein ACRCUN_10835 [Mycobacterium sp. LTG2003]